MKGQKFEIGQAVVIKYDRCNDPKKGGFNEKIDPSQILHIAEYVSQHGLWYCNMREWRSTHIVREDALEPIELTSEQLASMIEETISETV